jgi:hypothetical protein
MTAHYDRGARRESEEEVSEEVADDSGLSDTDGAQRDYSSQL